MTLRRLNLYGHVNKYIYAGTYYGYVFGHRRISRIIYE